MVLSLCGVAGAHAQAQTLKEPPATAPVLAGPLTLAPVIQSNAGHDNNLFNRSEPESPEGDFTATFTPSVDVWLRLPRAEEVTLARQYLRNGGEKSRGEACRELVWALVSGAEFRFNH